MAQNGDHSRLLYTRALEVCSYAQRQLVSEDGRLLAPIPAHELHRLQKLFFTSATLHMTELENVHDAVADYSTAVELVIRPPPPYTADDAYTMRELILAAFVSGYLLQGMTGGPIPREILDSLGQPAGTTFETLAHSGLSLFRLVRSAGDRLVHALLHVGGNALPFLLLLPDHVTRLPGLLFGYPRGFLPGICANVDVDPPGLSGDTIQQINTMTSTIFLALAKRYQDLCSVDVEIPGFDNALNINHSLAILFYYLALSLNPSPSTYNNMGIILSATTSTRSWNMGGGEQVLFDGSVLARVYYSAGLQLDPNHPHLLTNLGSLYKDQGRLDDAIR